MSKRMERTVAPTVGGFNEKLAALRKAAGFTQVELAAELETSRRLLAVEKLGTTEKQQVSPLIDAFIERGQLNPKTESRA